MRKDDRKQDEADNGVPQLRVLHLRMRRQRLRERLHPQETRYAEAEVFRKWLRALATRDDEAIFRTVDSSAEDEALKATASGNSPDEAGSEEWPPAGEENQGAVEGS